MIKLAARSRRRRIPPEVKALEELARPLPRYFTWQVIELPEHLQVFVAGEVFIDGGILAGQANARAERIGVFNDIKPGYLSSPSVGT